MKNYMKKNITAANHYQQQLDTNAAKHLDLSPNNPTT